MKHIKKYRGLLVVSAIVLVIAGLAWLNNKPKMILFYSNSCPHCQVVEEYIAANDIKSKFDFQELEVSENPGNAAIFAQKARQCGLDASQGLGVPLFFDGEKCLLGDEEIINYFKN